MFEPHFECFLLSAHFERPNTETLGKKWTGPQPAVCVICDEEEAI